MVTAEPAYLAAPSQQQQQQQQESGTTDEAAVDKHEPHSLAESRTSDQSENTTSGTSASASNHSGDEEDCEYEEAKDEQLEEEEEAPEIKCSAVHTLERDMPDYDYSHLVDALRQMILKHARKNEGTYSPVDLEKCRHDSWYLSRFLLRQKMDLLEAFEMLKRAMRFNHESLANHLKPEDFPAEFYQLGGLFPYGHDRKGNKMLYMRVKIHRKTPEINSIVQAFIYYNIKRLDEEAQGKGISIVIDCSGGGLQNADMDTLLFVISTLKNYFPKGLSYFLVHEIPWILKPFWHIAKAWVPEEHRQLIKFSDARTITEYVERSQLPDYLGGEGQAEDYKRVPENCVQLEQAAKLWGIEKPLMRGVFDKFKANLPEETVARMERYLASPDATYERGSSGAPEITTALNRLECHDDDSDDGLVADQEQEQQRA